MVQLRPLRSAPQASLIRGHPATVKTCRSHAPWQKVEGRNLHIQLDRANVGMVEGGSGTCFSAEAFNACRSLARLSLLETLPVPRARRIVIAGNPRVLQRHLQSKCVPKATDEDSICQSFLLPKNCHVSVGQVTTGNLIAGCFAARTAKPLGIFFGCIEFILRVTVSALDCGLKPLLPVAQSRSPFLGKEGDQLVH